LINTISDEETTTFHWKTRYPIANYNINFTIGKFHREQKAFTSVSGKQMPIVFYILDEHREKASPHLDMAMKMIRSHENYFGEYPFIEEKFGLVETPYLGMEHQTINAYGNQFRYTELGGEPFDWLLLHELGHEWWGNKVKAADWADYWIQEGICTYADALYHREVAGEEGYHKKMASARKGIRNEKPLIPKRNASTDEVYQGDIYGKGAYLLHSLRFIMGDERFFRALKQFASSEEFTYRNLVSETDFVIHFSSVSGVDLDPFISKMTYTTELPRQIVKEVKRNGFDLSVHGVDWLPVEVRIGDEIRKMYLTDQPVRVRASEKPVIDPNHWYLWRGDFDESKDN
jgi:aminopeptidase N